MSFKNCINDDGVAAGELTSGTRLTRLQACLGSLRFSITTANGFCCCQLLRLLLDTSAAIKEECLERKEAPRNVTGYRPGQETTNAHGYIRNGCYRPNKNKYKATFDVV